ncbi:MAG: glycosyltransferase family 4 protein [Burkholderiales bacterium]|nr:glycosyltransferase family 4 protein [Burkholderiales bacterium]
MKLPTGRGRILCVTSNFPRWAGDSTTPFVLHLANDLQRLGWEVDVLAPHAPGCALAETIEGVRVERFRYLWPERQQTVCYEGGALINLTKRRTDLLKLPLLVTAQWAAVLRRIVAGHYDLLHSHWILPQGFTGVMAAKVHHVPHVITVHGGDVFALRSKLMKRFKRFALQHADTITVNSSVTESAVWELEPGTTPVHRVPMGVAVPSVARDSVLASQIRARYRAGNGPLILFVGRMVEEKGIRDLIDAVGLLRETLPDVRVVLVGDGQDRREAEAYAAAAGLANRVNFTGWVQPAEVPSYMAAADVFVGPSRRAPNGWIEAQGLTYLEAMIARVPVIATRLGGVVDSVIPDRTGLLVDQQAPDQIARAVKRLVRDPALAARLAGEAHSHAASTFSRAASAAKFSELFAALVGAPGRAPV